MYTSVAHICCSLGLLLLLVQVLTMVRTGLFDVFKDPRTGLVTPESFKYVAHCLLKLQLTTVLKRYRYAPGAGHAPSASIFDAPTAAKEEGAWLKELCASSGAGDDEVVRRCADLLFGSNVNGGSSPSARPSQSERARARGGRSRIMGAARGRGERSASPANVRARRYGSPTPAGQGRGSTASANGRGDGARGTPRAASLTAGTRGRGSEGVQLSDGERGGGARGRAISPRGGGMRGTRGGSAGRGAREGARGQGGKATTLTRNEFAGIMEHLIEQLNASTGRRIDAAMQDVVTSILDSFGLVSFLVHRFLRQAQGRVEGEYGSQWFVVAAVVPFIRSLLSTDAMHDAHTRGRPHKEGVVVRQDDSAKGKRQWGVVSEGFFAVYGADMRVPYRVLTLQATEVIPHPQQCDPLCFALQTATVLRVYRAASAEEHTSWVVRARGGGSLMQRTSGRCIAAATDVRAQHALGSSCRSHCPWPALGLALKEVVPAAPLSTPKTPAAGVERRTVPAVPSTPEEEVQAECDAASARSSQYLAPGSPFGVHEGCTVNWLVDGRDVYKAMERAILCARVCIYIADWFLSPKLFLTRERREVHLGPFPPVTLDESHRIDTVLKMKASEHKGIHVFVLPWSETKLAMELDSKGAQGHLQSLGPNIHVLRHPFMVPVKWSHHQKLLIIDQAIAFVGGLDIALGRYDVVVTETLFTQRINCYSIVPTHPVTDEAAPHRFPGKDYYNPAVNELEDVAFPSRDLLDRSSVPRMGWHDVHAVCNGAPARDLANTFIQRWNHHKDDLRAQVPYLLPHSCIPLRSTDGIDARSMLSYASLPVYTGTMRVQIGRSLGRWNGGLSTPETSIYAAYVRALLRAEHFVYIENQYFISSLADNTVVRNEIAAILAGKIGAAIKKGRKFRVVVVVPVHPEGSAESAPVRYIMHWQYRTICRGAQSLQEQVKRCLPPDADASMYISFHSLANIGRLGSNLVKEQIYVHTKLLVVDDRIAIIGSANINDRSMRGKRDSEVCIVVEDKDMLRSRMNGESYNVGRFAHELRMSLWLEHTGLTRAEAGAVQDPLNDELFRRWWLGISRGNSDTIRRVFGPDWMKLRAVRANSTTEHAALRGHLIDFDPDVVPASECEPTYVDVDIHLAGDDVFT